MGIWGGRIFNKDRWRAFIKNKAARNFFVYLSASLANQTVSFFLLPILTRYLTPDDYGIIANFGTFLSMLIVLAGLSTQAAVNVNFFKLPRTELRIFMANVMLILIGSFGLLLIGVAVFRKAFVTTAAIPAPWLFIGVMLAGLQFATTINMTLWQVEQRATSYAIYQLSQLLLNTILGLLFVVGLGMGWSGRLTGQVIATSLFGMFSMVLIYKRGYFKFQYRPAYIKDALRFGVPLIPHQLSKWMKSSANRFIITSLLGASATGIYSLAYTYASLISLAGRAIELTWNPFVFERLSTTTQMSVKTRLVKLSYVLIGFYICLGGLLIGGIPIVFGYIVGPQFRTAGAFVFWILTGSVIDWSIGIVAPYIFYAKKTHHLPWITFSSGVLHIVLSYFFIQHNGISGAGQAYTLSSLYTFILTWIISAKVYPMPWLLRKTGEER